MTERTSSAPKASLRWRIVGGLAQISRVATPIRIVLDLSAWVFAIFIAGLLRFEMVVAEVFAQGFWRLVPIVVVLQLLTGTATGLYRRRWRYGSFDEVAALVAAAALNMGGLFLLNQFYLGTPRPVPQSAMLLGGAIGLLLTAGVRYTWRLVTDYLRRPSLDDAERLLIFSDGEVAVEVVAAMLRNTGSVYVPVGLIDDRRNRRRLSIQGVPVLGGRSELKAAAERSGATAILVALPEPDPGLMGEIADQASSIGLRVKVLPTVAQMLDGSISVAGIRNLTEADLLGRRQVDTNVEEIVGYVQGRRVLVTGAGGSIGSELCRQLSRYEPAELIMLDRDESALHAVEMSISGRAMLDTPNTALCNLRDADALNRIFEERRPEVVFHAAALKHLPLLEQFPAEGFKTNVMGTLNTLQAAQRVGVEVFVNISTDKAANPTSVLGYSKRVAERLTAHIGAKADGTYLSVRFGNVLGSRGSVLVAFREQIKAGGPVTVTDKNVTRFFMTVAEAVQLVIQAGAISHPGEVLVLDMGEPVRIYDIARRLIAQSGENIDIAITGLRPGEKLHEELFSDDEADHRPKHPLISHARVPVLDPDQLPSDMSPEVLFEWMRRVCGGDSGSRKTAVRTE